MVQPPSLIVEAFGLISCNGWELFFQPGGGHSSRWAKALYRHALLPTLKGASRVPSSLTSIAGKQDPSAQFLTPGHHSLHKSTNENYLITHLHKSITTACLGYTPSSHSCINKLFGQATLSDSKPQKVCWFVYKQANSLAEYVIDDKSWRKW